MGTESRNMNSIRLDVMSTEDIIRLMNDESNHALHAVENETEAIEVLVDDILKRDIGRVIYAGAGTSGRLGVLDAAECPPTFHTDPDEFIGLIAGGADALVTAVEGAEDSKALGADDIKELNVTEKDCVIGIAASGRTPYVIGALEEASERGVLTASISNNKNSDISRLAVHPIEIDSGAEIISGSTRLKAGTTQKLVLNIISTIVNIKRGKVYSNYMVDLNPSNKKLEKRAVQMIQDITDVSEAQAVSAFDSSGKHVKTAVLSLLMDISTDKAAVLLTEEPNVRKIIEG